MSIFRRKCTPRKQETNTVKCGCCINHTSRWVSPLHHPTLSLTEVSSQRDGEQSFIHSFLSLYLKIFFTRMSVLITYICIVCMPCVRGGQKKTSAPLELKLGTLVSLQKGAETQTQNSARTSALNW